MAEEKFRAAVEAYFVGLARVQKLGRATAA